MGKIDHPVFSNLQLPIDCEVNIKKNILYITKWNWDYEDCLKFQKASQEIIRNNRDHKIYIFCNHPSCFTLGRGNERGREDLVDFDESVEKNLRFPIHRIHRGGGITFHHPGQWIFYPIVSINQKYTLDDHMCWLLKSVKEILRDEFGLEKVMATKKLLGVWYERKKLASIGVGLNRFVTEHGIALNLIYNKDIFDELIKINPCGMDSKTYMSVDQLVKSNESMVKSFHEMYVSN